MRRDDPEVDELPPGPHSAPALPAEPHRIVAALAPMLTAARRARIAASVQRRTRSVTLALEAIDDPRNVAAILRSADAFGVQEVHLIKGEQPFVASRRITQGAERWLDIVHHRSARACVASLRERGFKVYVATMDGDVEPSTLVASASEDKVAFIFGNEQCGVSPESASLCDARYTVPMRGFVQSLNVSVAAAITLFLATQSRDGDLSQAERTELSARFMMLSVERAAEVVSEALGRTQGRVQGRMQGREDV